jgi:hemerythrin-like domain-containing protein
MRSCDLLKRDHALIGEVLRAVETLLDANEKGRTIPGPPLAGAMEFFGAFVERCHEAKEEQALFPILASLGILDGDALRTVQSEHGEGRRLLEALRAHCARCGIEREVGGLLGAYVSLQRHHMAFEDVSIFPRAEIGLSAEDDARVREAFERIEERVVGPGGRGALVALAGALTDACSALRAESPGRLALMARDVLRPVLGTVAPGDSLSRAGELMKSLETRELAVVEDDVLVGILTRSDMEPHWGHLEWTSVRTAMTPDPITVAPDAPIPAVARTLLDHGFNGIPVAVDRRMLGMIRRTDLVRLVGDHATR